MTHLNHINSNSSDDDAILKIDPLFRQGRFKVICSTKRPDRAHQLRIISNKLVCSKMPPLKLKV